MPVKLLTSGGGGVNLVPSSSIASDQTMYLPTSGTSGGTVLCTDSTGNLLLGTTSNKGLGITAQSSSNTIWTTCTSSGQSALVVQNSNGGAVSLVAFQVGSGFGTGVGSITSNGTSTTYATSSDYRLKEDYQPVADAITRLNQLKPINFAWKVDGSRCDGFLAHELQEVIPEAATGQKDEVDADGNPKYQGIDQSKIVPLLTAALQEAVAKIESLTQRIEALEYTKQGE